MSVTIYISKLLFGCPTANSGPLLRGQSHSPDVNHCVLDFRLEGHQEPRNEVGSLSLAERLVGFEPGTFRFLLQRLNSLGHSPPPKRNANKTSQKLCTFPKTFSVAKTICSSPKRYTKLSLITGLSVIHIHLS